MKDVFSRIRVWVVSNFVYEMGWSGGAQLKHKSASVEMFSHQIKWNINRGVISRSLFFSGNGSLARNEDAKGIHAACQVNKTTYHWVPFFCMQLHYNEGKCKIPTVKFIKNDWRRSRVGRSNFCFMPSARYFEILVRASIPHHWTEKLEVFMLLSPHNGVETLMEDNGMPPSLITFGWPQSVTRVKRNR